MIKSFKAYLNEENPWGYQENLFDIIFGTVRTEDEENKWYVPITKGLSEKLFPKQRIFAFHITDVYGLKKLKTIQHKRTSISVYQNRRKEELGQPAESGGNALVIVEGDVFIQGKGDIYSIVDSAGRRWSSMLNIAISLRVKDPDKIVNQYKKLLYALMKRYYPSINIQKMDFQEQPSNAFLSAYFKMVHKIIINASKMTDNRYGISKNPYNETILSNFKIVDVYNPIFVYNKNKTTNLLYKSTFEEIKKIWPKAKVLVMNRLSREIIGAKDFKQKMAKSIHDKIPSVEDLRW